MTNIKTDNRCILTTDCHTHTGFSDDCDISMDEMLAGAYAKGIQTLAITDHYDPGYPDPEFPANGVLSNREPIDNLTEWYD